MGREEKRLYTVGRFWLAEREQSPFLYIKWYDERTKVTRGKSTGRRSLEDAIPVILAHEEASRSNQLQPAEQVLALSTFIQFWNERGKTRRNAATVVSSLRIFTAFLDQDDVTIGATVAQLTPPVFERFIAWRLRPHSYSIEWQGKTFSHSSKGVSGEAVQRNLDDVRAALNHAEKRHRIPNAPKVMSVEMEHRSPARDARLTIPQLGAIVAYAAREKECLRWILGMLATGCRPDAVLAWSVKDQWGGGANFDTHPKGWPRTKKNNAVVPVIPEFQRWLKDWARKPHKKVASRKTWWRSMRAALDLPEETVPKTIRHTVATELRSRGVPLDQIAGLLGHISNRRITQGYAKYDPNHLPEAKQGLSAIWQEVFVEAHKWLTNHERISAIRGRNNSVAPRAEKVQENCEVSVVGADGLEPPTLSV